MPIKALLSSLDDVDEALRPLYVEQDIAGAKFHVLQIDGIDSHPTVRGLKTASEARRTKIIALETKVADLETRTAGLPDDFDADAFEALKAKADSGKGEPDPAAVERMVQARVDKAVKKATDAQAAAEARATKLEQQRNATERSRVLTDALTAAGVTDPNLLKGARAMLASQLEVAEGDNDDIAVVFVDHDLGTRVPASDWIKSWADTDEGKAFVSAKENSGGGAGGDGGQKAGVRNNPWKSDAFNMTEQHRIATSDPAMAKRLKAEAGIKD